MALSGSFQNLPVNNFGLYCTWSATQSVTGNYSDVTLNVYLKYYTLWSITSNANNLYASAPGEVGAYAVIGIP